MANRLELKELVKIANAQNMGGGSGLSVAKTPTTTNLQAPKAPARGGFLGFAGDVLGQTAKIAGQVGSAAVRYPVNVAKDIVSDAYTAGKTFVESQVNPIKARVYEEQSSTLNQAQDRLIADYKAGKVSKQDYTGRLKDLADARRQLMDDNRGWQQGESAGERIEAIAMTTGTLLSLGSLSLAKAGLKTAAKDAVGANLGKAGGVIEQQFMRNPAFRSLIERNAATLAKREGLETGSAQWIMSNARKIATDLLIKRPLVYQANLEDARTGLNSVLAGQAGGALKSAAFLGMQLLDGGPLGVAARKYTWLKGMTKELSYGKGSFIDEISKRIGDGSPNQLAEAVQKYGKDAEEVLRVWQNTALSVYKNDVVGAADDFMETYLGRDVTGLKAEDIIADLRNWRDADVVLQSELKNLVSAGKLSAEDAAKYTPVRWTQKTRDALAERIEATPDIQEQLQILQRYGDRYGFSQNSNLMNRLEYEINRNAGGGGDIAKAIREIDAARIPAKGITKTAQRKLAKLGFTFAEPKGGRSVEFVEDADSLPKLITGAVEEGTDLYDPAVAPQPVLGFAKNLLTKFGLSPEQSDRRGQLILTENIAKRLQGTSIAGEFNVLTKGGSDETVGTKALITKLQQYIENKQPSRLGRAITLGAADKAAITDIRQLDTDEIIEALGKGDFKITRSQASEIRSAIVQGYIDVPMEIRGLGNKLVDRLYQVNPLQRQYSRIQGALRYTYNPFFRVQEKAETSILSGISGGNKVKEFTKHLTDGNPTGIWQRTRTALDDTVKVLEDNGVLSGAQYGEAAQDQVLGRITANITKGQKRDLAGLALDMARKQGTTVEEMLRNNPDQLTDALRIVVQYTDKGTLASPLARTLNLAFFPMRYNAKVTQVAARALAKQPPTVQKMAIHSLLNLDQWLNSDEGIAWRQEHADAIQVFKWLTPINSVNYVSKILTGKAESVSDFGLLGGLPFGVISQILDSQGVIDLNTPYVDMRTGDVIPKYIPETLKARASVALVDLLGSTFTYPGRTLGLPGKNAALRDAVRKFIATKGDDFQVDDEMDNLTPMQLNMIRVLKGDTSDEAIDAVYNSAIDGSGGFTLPPANIDDLFVQPLTNVPQRPSKASTKGKKKKTARPMPGSTR